MRALLAAAIVAVGVGALGESNALASAANGAAIAKAAADAGAIERTNPQEHRSLPAGQGPMRSSAGVSPAYSPS